MGRGSQANSFSRQHHHCCVSLEPPHEWLDFEPETSISIVTGFLAQHVAHSGLDGIVVGVSGGLDSATTLATAAEALSPEQIDAVFMPGPTSPKADEGLAQDVAQAAGVELARVPITSPLQALEPGLGVEVDQATRANLQARLRMCILYARANASDRLVLGTGNKSELLTGYFTKHGDGAADLLPLGDVYKTQVGRIAEQLDVPEPVIERAPTAGLWEGQTDEDELGLSYDVLDIVLAGIEEQRGEQAIAEAARVSTEEVERVRELVHDSEHKRSLPPVPKLGWRTPGVDWREPTNE